MQRLRNLGVPESRIREVQETRANPRTLDWPAPAGGTVMVKRIINGQRVVAGDELYRIADLTQCLGDRRRRRGRSRRHQAGHARHRDVPRLSQPAGRRRRHLHLSGGADRNPHRPGEDRSRQSGRAAEAGHVRRRGVPASKASALSVTTVPTSAIIDTGARQIVLVAKGEGRFEPRPVKLGRRGDGHVEMLEGLKPGEEIVTTANFLIDAESNLQTALKTFAEPEADKMIAAVIRWSARNCCWSGSPAIFLTLAGLYAVSRVPLDAIPDLSDVQVIVYTEYPGQAPQVVEDQVTYPLTTAMLSVPKSRVVRGFSFFGVSFVYVIFEDGTDLYWARSRVLEYLNSAARRLPAGVAPSLGPDATGVGWVYQYVVRGAQKNLAELRSIQDWYIRYGLAKAEGVAEVASVGGFVKQYSVVIDPRRLQSLGHPAVENSRRASRRAISTSAAAPSSLPRPSSWCAGAATSRASPISSRSWSRTTAACRCCCATSRASSWRRTSGAASPN